MTKDLTLEYLYSTGKEDDDFMLRVFMGEAKIIKVKTGKNKYEEVQMYYT